MLEPARELLDAREGRGGLDGFLTLPAESGPAPDLVP